MTGITSDEGHGKVVKRASFLFADEQRKTHEQVLQHLRRHRNSYVHTGEGSTEVGAYLHQIRRYVEELLLFHLRNSRHFASQKRATRFLDLPSDPREIRHLIKTWERQAEEAKEAAQLARKGLQFREGS